MSLLCNQFPGVKTDLGQQLIIHTDTHYHINTRTIKSSRFVLLKDAMEKSPKSSSSPSSISSSRLWRPAAQRNLRNQWANLSSFKHKWASLSSSARSHATSLVNSSLNLRYPPFYSIFNQIPTFIFIFLCFVPCYLGT